MSAPSATTYGASNDSGLGYTEHERQENMRLALLAYRGRLPKPLIVKPKEADLNLRTNRCRTIVDTGVAFLFGQEVKFAVSESAGQTAQDDLDTAWDANHKALILESMAVNGGIFGHVYVKLLEDGVMEDGQAYPRVVVLDSQSVTVETDPDDCALATAYNICWQGKDAGGKSVQRRQRISRTDLPASGDPDAGGTDVVQLGAPEQWSIQNQIQRGQNSGGQDIWVNVGDVIEWPYAWCPVHACSNLPEPNTYYGAPDLTPDLVELQKALNFALSNRHKIMYHFAHPLPWAKGAMPTEIRNAVGEMTVFQSPDAAMFNLEISGAGVAALDNHIEDIRTDMDELSGVPGVATGRIKDMLKGAVPGITIRMEFQPLITKTNKKRECYGGMLETLNSHMLEMLGHGEGVDVENIWQDVLPVNMAEWATFAPVLQTMGVSKQTLVGQAGYDWDAEQERSQLEQAADADLAQQAMSNFDAGKTPGAVGIDPNAQGLGDVMSALNANGATGPTPPPPAVSAAALNHPAMQAARANAAMMAKP